MTRPPAILLFGLWLAAYSVDIAAQDTSGQLWGTLTLGFPRAERYLFEVEFEPRVQVTGRDDWWSVDTTPAFEVSLNRWIEFVAQTYVSRTAQSSAVTSVEVTPRAGFRFHVLNNLLTMLPGTHPLGRVGFSSLSRIEWRNLSYSDDTPATHDSRFRNRFEVKAGVNHGDMALDRTIYLTADFEIFVPLSGDSPERFATKRRTRAGLGYRKDRKWRYELFYIHDATRETEEERFAPAANIVDFKVKVFF